MIICLDVKFWVEITFPLNLKACIPGSGVAIHNSHATEVYIFSLNVFLVILFVPNKLELEADIHCHGSIFICPDGLSEPHKDVCTSGLRIFRCYNLIAFSTPCSLFFLSGTLISLM